VVDTLVLTSVWAVQVLRGLCQDAENLGLISMGVAAVGASATAGFTAADVQRLKMIVSGNGPSVHPALPLPENTIVGKKGKANGNGPAPDTATAAAATEATEGMQAVKEKEECAPPNDENGEQAQGNAMDAQPSAEQEAPVAMDIVVEEHNVAQAAEAATATAEVVAVAAAPDEVVASEAVTLPPEAGPEDAAAPMDTHTDNISWLTPRPWRMDPDPVWHWMIRTYFHIICIKPRTLYLLQRHIATIWNLLGEILNI